MVVSITLGLAKGSSVCMITCAPGIVPYLISKQYDWKKCLKLGIIFNLPRIIALTILGMILGYISYSIKEWLETAVPNILGPIQIIAYGILGIFILILGAYMFTSSVDAKEDIKESKEEKKGKDNKKSNRNKDKAKAHNQSTKKDISCDVKKSRRAFSIQERFKYLESKPNTFFLIWGSMISFACLGEVIIYEAAIIWTSIGVISNSLGQAVLYGGSAMFILAIGASIPLIIVATLSSSFNKYFENVEKLESLRSIGGIVLIMMGLFYLIGLITYLISLI